MTNSFWYLSSSNIHGIGVFSKKKFLPNSFVDTAIDEHQEVTYFGSKINHSWNPSCRLIYNSSNKTYGIYTIKELYSNDEITVDYTFTPPFIKKPDLNWK